jgi:plastocyanin
MANVRNSEGPSGSNNAARIGARLLAVVAAALVLVTPVDGAPAAIGRIIGHVRLVAVGSGRPLAVNYQSRALTTPGQAPKEIRNVVVFLDGMPATATPSRTYELRQEGEVFLPHVLAVARGSSVDFTNEDAYYHNVFSLSRAGTFDLGRYPRGQSRSRRFTSPGLVKVFCHIHSDMSAVVMVFDHPWFTTPGADGTFAIDDVPAGTRTVAAWHERIGAAKKPVTVPAGGEVRLEFVLPVVEP